MKMMNSKIILTGALFALWTAQNASAWYDPALGRWLTRDPIGEPGFQALQQVQQTVAVPSGASSGRWINRDSGISDDPNLYTFVYNEPITQIDPWGLVCNCKSPSCHPSPKPNGCSSPDKGHPKD